MREQCEKILAQKGFMNSEMYYNQFHQLVEEITYRVGSSKWLIKKTEGIYNVLIRLS